MITLYIGKENGENKGKTRISYRLLILWITLTTLLEAFLTLQFLSLFSTKVKTEVAVVYDPIRYNLFTAIRG